MAFSEVPMGYTLAPKRLVDNRMTVRYMYREMLDHPSDTGWRFFSGLETDEFVNDPHNSGIYDIRTIIDVDPDIVLFLNQPYGCAYERYHEDEMFVEVRD